MAEIVSTMKKVSEMMIDVKTIYNIPNYQREFVWNRKEVEQLLNDISDDSYGFTVDSSRLEGYLLGNIVLIGDEEKVDVVDGQ